MNTCPFQDEFYSQSTARGRSFGEWGSELERQTPEYYETTEAIPLHSMWQRERILGHLLDVEKL